MDVKTKQIRIWPERLGNVHIQIRNQLCGRAIRLLMDTIEGGGFRAGIPEFSCDEDFLEQVYDGLKKDPRLWVSTSPGERPELMKGEYSVIYDRCGITKLCAEVTVKKGHKKKKLYSVKLTTNDFFRNLSFDARSHFRRFSALGRARTTSSITDAVCAIAGELDYYYTDMMGKYLAIRQEMIDGKIRENDPDFFASDNVRETLKQAVPFVIRTQCRGAVMHVTKNESALFFVTRKDDIYRSDGWAMLPEADEPWTVAKAYRDGLVWTSGGRLYLKPELKLSIEWDEDSGMELLLNQPISAMFEEYMKTERPPAVFMNAGLGGEVMRRIIERAAEFRKSMIAAAISSDTQNAECGTDHEEDDE